MKVLITGNRGYIGRMLHGMLAKNGNYDWIDGVDLCLGTDITTQKFVDDYAGKYDIVFHLAAYVDCRKSVEEPEECFHNNINGVLNVIRLKPSMIVFASTMAVYGNEVANARPDCDTDPATPYGMSKVIGEYLIKQSGIPYRILRLGCVFGGSELSRSIVDKLSYGLKIYGDGEQTRDYVHLYDVVAAFMQSPQWEQGIYNVGNGIPYSVNQIADMRGTRKEYIPAVPEQRSCYLDNSKTIKAGWKPAWPLKKYLSTPTWL